MASEKEKNLTMSDKTEIATSIETKNNDNEQKSTTKIKTTSPKQKTLVTKLPSDEEEKKSSSNTRGIPRAIYLENPYNIIYKNQQERYLKEVEQVLGKYKLMENQLVKQKMNKIDQKTEMKKNISACKYLKTKKESGSIETTFEVSDQLYSYGTVKKFDNVAIWLGANVMLEFPIDEAVDFLKKRIIKTEQKINRLQTDIDFCRKQINIVEVNRSRVYNANVKVKKAKEEAQKMSNK